MSNCAHKSNVQPRVQIPDNKGRRARGVPCELYSFTRSPSPVDTRGNKKYSPANTLTRLPATQQFCSTPGAIANSPCSLLMNDSIPSKQNPSARISKLMPAEIRWRSLDIEFCLQLEKLCARGAAVSVTIIVAPNGQAHSMDKVSLQQPGVDRPATEEQSEKCPLISTNLSRAHRCLGP
jgi:hypothetical protein